MGNYRFKLSDMMPNAWFYKLRDMGRRNKKKIITSHHSYKKKPSSSSSPSTMQPSKERQSHQLSPRKSYYFTRELNPKASRSGFCEPPRKSSKQTSNRRITMAESSSEFDSSGEPEFPEPEIRTDSVLLTEAFHRTPSGPSKADDILMDVEKSSIARKDVKLRDYHPPITIKKKETKPNTQNSLKIKIVKEDTTSSIKQQRNTTPGVRLRTKSPRIGSRKTHQIHGRRSVSPPLAAAAAAASSSSRRRMSESLAIVKTSWNPERDFRESMVEMIVENKMKGSKDFEDLLACYLDLNSDEYHELIIKVFKQVLCLQNVVYKL